MNGDTFFGPVILSITLACLLFGGCSAQDSDDSQERPNILLIVADDLNTRLGAYGDEQVKSPNLDRLAEEGVLFSNAHANTGWCAPSRTSLFTGLHPETSRIFAKEYYRDQAKTDSARSMFRYFQDAGYSVYGVGKVYHNRKVTRAEEEFTAHGPRGQRTLAVRNGKPRIHPRLYDINPPRGYGGWGPLSDVPNAENYGEGWEGWNNVRYEGPEDRGRMPDERFTDWAIEQLDKQQGKDQPFMMTVGYFKPHTPHYTPDRFHDLYPRDEIELPEYRPDDLNDVIDQLKDDAGTERWNRLRAYEADGTYEFDDWKDFWRGWLRGYFASISFMDHQIGRLLDALEENGLDRNTIVIFTSDQGFHNGQKLRVGKNAPWDPTTKVPLIVRKPGSVQPGGVADAPVSLVDVYPTVLEMTGLDDSPHGDALPLDGHSLLPLLKQPMGGELEGPNYVLFQRGQAVYSVRGKDYRYVLNAQGQEEFYDLVNDPDEVNNVAGQAGYSEVQARLKDQMFEMLDGRLPTEK